ncbi:hypothetical protein KCV87_32730 [Actinosynnema pretiosum subsp. pretiosum]|uniref:Uncharacterized protein n=1 Tax=Actinosynnema pretiosum subsp. pretiosum TaxID=103721 RepID=A0AA45L685_9PSEU|nr:hypothetical protein APASM_4595 [Actinosynnema pretiosum subsp. pretiosum]QUF04061.1 hypothetical protein KCV87_32730 [Actinosynnema pretiosum subsp. pretiosum]
MLDYLHRTVGDRCELGGEVQRYHEFALADLQAEPDPVAPHLQHLGGKVVSTSRAPLAPAGTGNGEAHTVLRMMMEDIAESPMPQDREADRLRVLAHLDGLPVDAREELGQTLLEFMKTLASWDGEGVRTETRIMAPNPGSFAPMVFMVASAFNELVREVFRRRVHLAHYDHHGETATDEQTVVGVLLTPTVRPGRLWDTTMFAVAGPHGYQPEGMEEIRAEFIRSRP